jgi:hypothetical protein
MVLLAVGSAGFYDEQLRKNDAAETWQQASQTNANLGNFYKADDEGGKSAGLATPITK